MRIRQVLVFALVALFTFVGVAHAAKITPIVSVNAAVTTVAEQISANGGTACQSLRICNATAAGGVKLVVKNSATVTATDGISLFANASTADVESRCLTINPVQLPGSIKTVDATTWYGITAAGTVSVEMICIP